MSSIKQAVMQKVRHNEELLKKMEHFSSDTHTFYGGYDLGYVEGELSVLWDLRGILEEEEVTNNE